MNKRKTRNVHQAPKTQTKTAKKRTEKRTHENKTVIAISPYSDGFGYAVFESPQNLLDWGVTNLNCNKFHRARNRFEMLLTRYLPNAVTIQMPSGHVKYKTLAHKIVHTLSKRCAVGATPFLRLKRKDIRDLFQQFGAITKEQIAQKLVEFLPELTPYKPKHRAIWEKEHRNMKIFDAASLALTFYDQLEDIMNLPYHTAKSQKHEKKHTTTKEKS